MKRFVSPYFRFRLLVSGANSRRFFSRVFRSHLLVIGALRDDSVREKWDRREENRQSLFSPLIEKPEEEQRDDVLESDFDTVTQYESV